MRPGQARRWLLDVRRGNLAHAGKLSLVRLPIDSGLNHIHRGRLLGDWGLSSVGEVVNGRAECELQTAVDDNERYMLACPWQPRDLVRVQEPFAFYDGVVRFDTMRHRPASTMRHRDSRSWFRVVDVHLQRVQAASEEDVLAEYGCTGDHGSTITWSCCRECDRLGRQPRPGCSYCRGTGHDHLARFRDRWIHEHGPDAWLLNPWTWLAVLQKVERP